MSGNEEEEYPNYFDGRELVELQTSVKYRRIPLGAAGIKVILMNKVIPSPAGFTRYRSNEIPKSNFGTWENRVVTRPFVPNRMEGFFISVDKAKVKR